MGNGEAGDFAAGDGNIVLETFFSPGDYDASFTFVGVMSSSEIIEIETGKDVVKFMGSSEGEWEDSDDPITIKVDGIKKIKNYESKYFLVRYNDDSTNLTITQLIDLNQIPKP